MEITKENLVHVATKMVKGDYLFLAEHGQVKAMRFLMKSNDWAAFYAVDSTTRQPMLVTTTDVINGSYYSTADEAVDVAFKQSIRNILSLNEEYLKNERLSPKLKEALKELL